MHSKFLWNVNCRDIIEWNSYKLLTYSSCAHTQLYYSFAVYECTYVDFMKNHKLRFPAKWYKCIFYLDWGLKPFNE